MGTIEIRKQMWDLGTVIVQSGYVSIVENGIETKSGINQNFNFWFDCVTTDTLSFHFVPKYSPDTVYSNIVIQKGQKNSIKLKYNPYCKYYRDTLEKTCPICHSDDKVVKIVYGLQSKPLDKEKYKAGGCMVKWCQPYWYCKRDNIDF